MVVISTALHFPAVLLWQMGALLASVLTYLLTMFMSLRIDANNRIEQLHCWTSGYTEITCTIQISQLQSYQLINQTKYNYAHVKPRQIQELPPARKPPGPKLQMNLKLFILSQAIQVAAKFALMVDHDHYNTLSI